jgi:hypothetical protein
MARFLRHLLPLLSPSFVPSKSQKVITKIISDLDTYSPFRQHGPSLANAREKIYADIDQLASVDGVGFFNILAFRGVFFGSPFAKSKHYRWFHSLEDWEHFQDAIKNDTEVKKYKGEVYYVKKNCYGQTQIGRKLSLLSSYWDQRLEWNNTFNKPEKPTIMEVFQWLVSRVIDIRTTKSSTKFRNIGHLTALLICGDIVEAGVLSMPSAHEWAEVIAKVGKGGKAGMEACGLVEERCDLGEFCAAFVSLDQALQIELGADEKEAMGYNVIMLEHALCKISRITNRGISKEILYSEIDNSVTC